MASVYQDAIQQKISWNEFQQWYQGFEHVFAGIPEGPTYNDVQKIIAKLSLVRGRGMALDQGSTYTNVGSQGSYSARESF